MMNRTFALAVALAMATAPGLALAAPPPTTTPHDRIALTMDGKFGGISVVASQEKERSYNSGKKIGDKHGGIAVNKKAKKGDQGSTLALKAAKELASAPLAPKAKYSSAEDLRRFFIIIGTKAAGHYASPPSRTGPISAIGFGGTSNLRHDPSWDKGMRYATTTVYADKWPTPRFSGSPPAGSASPPGRITRV